MLSQEKAEKLLVDAAHHVYRCGYQPVYIALHGSQNYGLDTPQSDFDFQCVVVPTLDDLIQNRVISTTLEYEGGLIEVKDIREQVKSLLKMNPTYIEVFLTPYAISLCHVPQIGIITSLIPNLLEERGRPYMEALFGIFFRYSTRTVLNNGLDYNPKAAYQSIRAVCMMEEYLGNKKFLMVPNEDDRKTILAAKTHEFPKCFLPSYIETLQITARSLIDAARTELPEPSFETANQIKALSDQIVRDFITGEKKIAMQEEQNGESH